MKDRIFSIMDMSKKKVGAAVLCGALLLTLGTGSAFAATQNPSQNTNVYTEITPWIASAFLPNPDVYAKYTDFGIAISDDGAKLLYNGQPVRLFVDEKSAAETFYLNEIGSVNLSVVRNTAGEILGIERISVQKAQEYQDVFFAEELSEPFPKAQDIEKVQEGVQAGEHKYETYLPFGITYSAADGVLRYNGQRVKFFIDGAANKGAYALWTDEAGTVNLAVARDASGRITGIESISDKKAREYQSRADEYAQIDADRLEEKLEAKMKRLYPSGTES